VDAEHDKLECGRSTMFTMLATTECSFITVTVSVCLQQDAVRQHIMQVYLEQLTLVDTYLTHAHVVYIQLEAW